MTEDIFVRFKQFLYDSYHQTDPLKGAQFVFILEPSVFNNISKNTPEDEKNQFFWKKPKEEIFFHSFGRIETVKVFGFNQLILSKEIFNNLKTNFLFNREYNSELNIPFLVGNEEFSRFSKNSIWEDFTNNHWYIPEFILFQQKDTRCLVYNFLFSSSKEEILKKFQKTVSDLFSLREKENFPPPTLKNRMGIDINVWTNLVNKSLKQINEKHFQKVVLSRTAEFDIAGKLNFKLLHDISEKYPDCITFLNKSGNSIFFGVTPERLLKVSGRDIETESLAGSTGRSSLPEEDKILSNQLLHSSKNLLEQRFVTNYIVDIIKHYCTDLKYSDEPELIKLENIQHLKTGIKAKIREGFNCIDLLNELHPTPAVCGFPKEKALDFIIENEGYDRGLYSGIAGWCNLCSQGDFAVAIRSALIKENKLYAFTGCGIVDGSNPAEEFEETELKLKPILSLFDYENSN